MILQALVQHYEDLLALGQITPQGWSSLGVSFGLELDAGGGLLSVTDLRTPPPTGKKNALLPRSLPVPEQVKRSSGVAANFLCDNARYLLGLAAPDPKATAAKAEKDRQRAAQCFAAAKQLHLKLLQGASGPAACAVRAFFERWNPDEAQHCAALLPCLDELLKGGNLLFYHARQPVTDDPELRACWQQRRQSAGDASDDALCLVTGRHGPAARLHRNIKGVAGAQSSGASLVSFNVPAFCSFGHEQGGNAPTSAYAAFAYVTALNALLADREHCRRAGDTTLVCWAAGGQTAYQDCLMDALFDDDVPSERDLRGALFRLARGEAIDWQAQTIDPATQFYVLGLAPNAARLSVRFFWQNSFGALARNVWTHYNQLEIVRPAYEPSPTLPIWKLLRETANQNARSPEPPPRLAGDLLLAVLNGSPYPATLLNGVVLRIRAEREVTYGRAAILKAYFLRNSKNKTLKEAIMTVELNEETCYLPYVLGRLFAVLERVQESANPGLNTTIKDRYFNAASATPATVFPLLTNLAQKHLAKLDGGLAAYYNRQISALYAKIGQTLPARLALEEQGAFQIGYYHQVQKFYQKKKEEQ